MDKMLVYVTDKGIKINDNEFRSIKTKRVGPWRGNNRRTDYWFIYLGRSWHGFCGEGTTAFYARAHTR